VPSSSRWKSVLVGAFALARLAAADGIGEDFLRRFREDFTPTNSTLAASYDVSYRFLF